MIHIEGMGVLGSLLALKLDHAGIKFTWSDADAEHTAWKACTGAIYPCGEPESVDWLAYNLWRDELSKPTWTKPVSRHFERAVYVFNHQRPPHDGRYEFSNLGNSDLRFPLVYSSYHVNAQTLVPAVRKRFADRRTDGIALQGGKDRPRVIAHGFTEKMTHAYWGWTRMVELDYKFKLSDRPAFYFRQGRYVMAYAYPAPGTPYWYAGSSLIMQHNLKPLQMEPKFERWQEFFEMLSGDTVRVKRTRSGEFLQGWRPAEANPDVYWDKRKKIIRMPSLWNSGVRHAPYYIEAVTEIMRHANYR